MFPKKLFFYLILVFNSYIYHNLVCENLQYMNKVQRWVRIEKKREVKNLVTLSLYALSGHGDLRQILTVGIFGP